MTHHITHIEEAWEDSSALQRQEVQNAIEEVIKALDQGHERVAYSTKQGWKVNDWAKKAVVLYFRIRNMEPQEAGPLTFYDKILLKQDFKQLGVRAVPPCVARYGACLRKGVVLMASYVNIGAYIDEGTMVDIGAVVGSCAQLGKRIHVSANAVIGGVLEPLQAKPVIIEDDVFIGAHCSVVEGVYVKRGAVLGANLTLTASTKIIDVTQQGEAREHRGYIPENVVVIPGTYPKQFPAGVYQVPCALIIGQRSERTDGKLALNEALRHYAI